MESETLLRPVQQVSGPLPPGCAPLSSRSGHLRNPSEEFRKVLAEDLNHPGAWEDALETVDSEGKQPDASLVLSDILILESRLKDLRTGGSDAGEKIERKMEMVDKLDEIMKAIDVLEKRVQSMFHSAEDLDEDQLCFLMSSVHLLERNSEGGGSCSESEEESLAWYSTSSNKVPEGVLISHLSQIQEHLESLVQAHQELKAQAHLSM